MKKILSLDYLSEVTGGVVYDFVGPLGGDGYLLYSKDCEDAVFISPAVFNYNKSIAVAVNDGAEEYEIEDYIVKSILEDRKCFDYISVYKDVNDFFYHREPKLTYYYDGLCKSN